MTVETSVPVAFPATAGVYWGKKKGADEWQFIVRVSGTAPFLVKKIECHVVPRALPIHIGELNDFEFGPPVEPPNVQDQPGVLGSVASVGSAELE